MKSHYVRYIILGGNTTESDFSGSVKNIPFKIVDNFAKSGLSAELQNMRAYNEAGQSTKPEDLRYIIVGYRNAEGKFRELKALFANVHWIKWKKVSSCGGTRTVTLILSAVTLTKQNVGNMTSKL